MGQRKQLRSAAKNNFALETGERPFSGKPLGAGQLRARARLREQRIANEARLNPKPNLVEQITTAVTAIKKIANKIGTRKKVAVATEVNSAVADLVAAEAPAKAPRKSRAKPKTVAEVV